MGALISLKQCHCDMEKVGNSDGKIPTKSNENGLVCTFKVLNNGHKKGSLKATYLTISRVVHQLGNTKKGQCRQIIALVD